jgi:hypothetical protein
MVPQPISRSKLPSTEKEVEMKSKHYVVFLLLIVAVIMISSCSAAATNPNTVWHTYENQKYGYSFNYPPDCTYGPLPVDCKSAPLEEQRDECLCFLDPENPERVLMQTFQTDGDQLVMAEFSIAHLTTPADNPPNETGLMDWLAGNFPDKWERAEARQIEFGGNSAVSIFIPQSDMAPALKEIYFMHHDGLFQISLLNPNLEINNSLYERILPSFRFDQ